MVACILAATASLVATPPTPAGAIFDGPELVFTLDGIRINAQELDGAVIPAGSNLAIWIAPRFHPARRVNFYLNGEHVQTENSAPWDLSGTGPIGQVQSLWSSELPEGTNTVEARISGWFGFNSTLRATFTRAPADSTSAPGFDGLFDTVDRELDTIVRDEQLNGAGVVIVHPDRGIVHESYVGQVDAQRVSLTASSNKMITAGVLLRLDDTIDGFDIHDPISDHVDWGASLPGVTTAQLLSNSSGLPGLITGYPLNLCIADRSITVETCGRRIANNPLDDLLQAAPGERYQYGGPQWQVAGAVAEAVSGRSWDQLIEETYRQPCGLDVLGYTTLFSPELLLENIPLNGDFTVYPRSFDGNVSRLPVTSNPTIEGGGYTTPHDYADLLLMLLRDGMCGNQRVLSTDSIDEMFENQLEPGVLTDNGFEYGLGWIVDGDVRIDPGFFGAIARVDLTDDYGVYFVVEDVALPGVTPDRDALFDAIDTAMSQTGLPGAPTPPAEPVPEPPLDPAPPAAPCIVEQVGADVRLTWEDRGSNAYYVRRNDSWAQSVFGATTTTATGSISDSWVVRYWPTGGSVDIACTPAAT